MSAYERYTKGPPIGEPTIEAPRPRRPFRDRKLFGIGGGRDPAAEVERILGRTLEQLRAFQADARRVLGNLSGAAGSRDSSDVLSAIDDYVRGFEQSMEQQIDQARRGVAPWDEGSVDDV